MVSFLEDVHNLIFPRILNEPKEKKARSAKIWNERLDKMAVEAGDKTIFEPYKNPLARIEGGPAAHAMSVQS